MITRTPVTSGLHGLTLTRDRADASVARARSVLDERSPEGKARKAAEDLVSVSLIEPTLKLLRETNNAASPFAPGEAEKAFGPLLDKAISERVVKASGFGIVDRLASDLLKHGKAISPGAIDVGA
jgi:Rod binding domain-containing protein